MADTELGSGVRSTESCYPALIMAKHLKIMDLGHDSTATNANC